MEKDEKRQQEKKVSQPAPRKAKPQKPDEASCLVSQREASMKNKSREPIFFCVSISTLNSIRFAQCCTEDFFNNVFHRLLMNFFSLCTSTTTMIDRELFMFPSAAVVFFLRFSRHSPTWYLSRENFPFRNAMPTSLLSRSRKKNRPITTNHLTNHSGWISTKRHERGWTF